MPWLGLLEKGPPCWSWKHPKVWRTRPAAEETAGASILGWTGMRQTEQTRGGRGEDQETGSLCSVQATVRDF